MRWFTLLKTSKWTFHIIIGIHTPPPPLRIDNYIQRIDNYIQRGLFKQFNEFLEGPVGNN